MAQSTTSITTDAPSRPSDRPPPDAHDINGRPRRAKPAARAREGPGDTKNDRDRREFRKGGQRPAPDGAASKPSTGADTLSKADPTSRYQRTAKADSFDGRDRLFRPNVSVAPRMTMFAQQALAVRDQGETNACTGFAMALVVDFLLRKSGREIGPTASPFMLYSMARRYDEFPGSQRDSGSSLRGVLKGWYKHGVCRHSLFPTIEMPAAIRDPKRDWWQDAVRRPLGAYYRIETRSITAMHSALNEVGILLASAGCHPGWQDGFQAAEWGETPNAFVEFGQSIYEIPQKGHDDLHPGHAFAIIGYNEAGFLIQNSWGSRWGSHGMAVLTYDDWLRNAMDCWVAQLGVLTHEHLAIATSESLRTDKGRVKLAASRVLRDREISPFILNIANNGALSNSGTFRTSADDVRAMVDIHLAQARERWTSESDQVLDVCIYAHGGLVGEKDAATMAAEWIPLLYEARIFPIFIMWETDFVSTVMHALEDALKGVPRTTGFGESLERWWNQRLERFLARPGTQIWGEMKQNASAISEFKDGVPDELQAGAVLLYEQFRRVYDESKIRLHFIGHSAGAIVGAHMIARLVERGMKFDSVSFMAPAVSVDTFQDTLLPAFRAGQIARYQQFHLSAQAEEDDPSCRVYRRSLLYLVSESFEGGTRTPILGMQKYFDAFVKKEGLKGKEFWSDPIVSPQSAAESLEDAAKGLPVTSSTHGGFDNDPGARQRIIEFIQQTRLKEGR